MANNNTKIPEFFLNMAAYYGIPTKYAIEIYLTKLSNKAIDSSFFVRLVLDNVFDSEIFAKRRILDLWSEWNKASKTGFVATPVVEAVDSLSPVVDAKDFSLLERASLALDQMIGKTPTFYPESRVVEDSIAVAGDFHIPFHDEEALVNLLNHPARTLIIPGDFFDMYRASSHRKNIDYISVSEELAIAKAILIRLAEHFEDIYFLNGNHCNRPLKQLQSIAPQLLPLLISPVELISKDLPNVHILNVTIPGTAPATSLGENVSLDFTGVYENILVGHFEKFCGDDATLQLDSYLSKIKSRLPFNLSEIDIILQAHTHRLNLRYTPEGRQLVSTGCMCKPQEYIFQNHNQYNLPTLGYVTLYRNSFGDIDHTLTQLVKL
jgi:UDP-2,3-diacylglucosamine pyrophosphatase LpxH